MDSVKSSRVEKSETLPTKFNLFRQDGGQLKHVVAPPYQVDFSKEN